MSAFTSIHPFPARMASEIAFQRLRALPTGSIVADPMCGSGTVLRVAAEVGHRCIGFDLDPLAVLMARVWTSNLDIEATKSAATELVAEAQQINSPKGCLPWIDQCTETKAFVERWFEPGQQEALRRLAYVLVGRSGAIADALRLAMSRIIITKERGASIARDTSHSRPHIWFAGNSFDVWKGFISAADRLTSRLRPESLIAQAVVNQGDARCMNVVPDCVVDAIVTSPPYLNAIDYMRGHRLALVWLGYRVPDLRRTRAANIGTENSSSERESEVIGGWLTQAVSKLTPLPNRQQKILQRYAEDLSAMLKEQRRILKPGGHLTAVVGDSRIRGTFVRNSTLFMCAAEANGFRHLGSQTRSLPNSRRYLPIARGAQCSALEGRMKEEVVLTFSKF